MAEPQRARCVDLTMRSVIARRHLARASRPAAALCMMDCACSWSDQSQDQSRIKRLRCHALCLGWPCLAVARDVRIRTVRRLGLRLRQALLAAVLAALILQAFHVVFTRHRTDTSLANALFALTRAAAMLFLC